MSKAAYKKSKIICFIVAILITAFSFGHTKMIAVALTVLFFGLLTVAVLSHFGLFDKKRVELDDYEVTSDVLSHTEGESYIVRNAYGDRTVSNYTLYFESGKSWHIPEDNYLWSKERPMSDFAIHQSSHRGDSFIVVVKKDTGKIATAYNTEFFEYKK